MPTAVRSRRTPRDAAAPPVVRFAVGLASAVTAAVLGLAACDGTRTPPVAGPHLDPGAVIVERSAALTPDGPYRDPTRTERIQARRAVRAVLSASTPTGPSAAQIFAGLGFQVSTGVDPVTGRPFTLFLDESGDRGWGALLVDQSVPVRVVIEVPHPRFDISTDRFGVDVHRLIPGSVLLVAGAHRAAAGEAADVAHNDDSMFHVLATELARSAVPQIQLHGFADRNLPGAEVVVSNGAAEVGDLAQATADRLAGIGLVTCRAWVARCGRLEGTTNAQGRAAATVRAPFVHLEIGWSVRADPGRRDQVARALAALFTGG